MRVASSFFALTCCLSAVLPSPAQTSGQNESLAPYIPTPQIIVEKMLEAAGVKPGDTVYDLGSGDGRIIITAAKKYGAKAVGVELSEELCRRTNERIKAMGLEDRVKIIHGNLLDVDLSPADVVTLYLLTSSNERLKPNLEKYLKPGTRVVSNDFEIRGWKARGVVKITSGNTTHSLYVYEIERRK
ncbi:MAG TPA: class I SAM-dependent methyltransferase [Bryobacteraceae bacterium]|nr:class I SAM-dependent methyltransferase [Bryobacteraceae bacterium]